MVCVSTQVMEAGVDISFECVIRLTAGMDSIIQAAGRCNRNGERPGILPVYLLDCADENMSHLREIRDAKAATTTLLDRFHRDPDRYGSNLASRTASDDYYRILYHEMPVGYQDFTFGKTSLYDLLSYNTAYYRNKSGFILNQAFRTAGREFQVLEADTTSVVVPYGVGRQLIQAFSSAKAEQDLSYTQSLLRQAKPYIVNLYQYQFEALAHNQGLGHDKNGRIFWLEEGWYDDVTGLITERQKYSFLEV